MKIDFFKNKIIREPLFSLNNYFKIPNNSKNLDKFIDELFNDCKFKDAIFLSSPELFYEWEKQLLISNSNRTKINNSILKFYIRSISNTVPFGLFSSYSISEASDNCDEKYSRFSNIDMDYLSKLVFHLNRIPLVRKIVRYKKNNTVYKVGDKLRYIEPDIINDKLSYTLTSIESNEVIEFLFETLEDNFSYNDIFEKIYANVEGLDEDTINSFINELIESKFIISDFDICLNKKNLLQQVILFFESNFHLLSIDSTLVNIYYNLVNIDIELKNIDKKIFCDKNDYEKIYSYFDNIGLEYNRKFIVNSNIRKNEFKKNSTNHDDRIKEAIKILNKISFSPLNVNKNLIKFKEAFYNRYEDQEMPLLEVIDNELGIGYLQHLKEQTVFSELIDDIQIPFNNQNTQEINVEPAVFSFWINQFNKNKRKIDLLDEDLSVFKESKLKKGTFTFSYSFNNDKIYIKSIGGYSGSTLLGRFSNNDFNIQQIINEISEFENKCFDDKITAEIIHLPNNRVGNVLIREVKRKKEISILAKNSVNSLNIPLEDLYVSIKNDKIILTSKTENKEILPFLTSAQNYHFDSLPLYQFLCDIQSQYRNNFLGINFGGLDIEYLDHIPRISFGESIILSKETWKISTNQLKKNYNTKDSKISLNEFRNYLKSIGIDKYIYITEGGEDKLIIDIDNDITLNVLFEELNKNKTIKLTECIYELNSHSINFSNEILTQIKITDNQLLEEIYQKSFEKNLLSVKRSFILGEEWLYMKIYTGHVTSIDVLINEIKDLKNILLNMNYIDKWFYIRYNDPEFHIRVRFKIIDNNNLTQIIKLINDKLSLLIKNKKIWKVDFSPYNRELERYNWNDIDNVESLFYADSDFSINLLEYQKTLTNNSWIIILRSIDDILDAFQYSLEEKYELINLMYDSFWKEFNSDKNIKKSIDKKFRTFEKEIDSLFFDYPECLCKAFIERKKHLSKIIFSTNNLDSLMWSFIHMHVNRVIKSNPRFHELIIYGILEKYYRKKIGLKKFKLNEVNKAI